MGLFDKLFGKENTAAKTNAAGSEAIIRMMLAQAQVAMDAGDDARAVECYRNILKLESNDTARYNLASLYAQGRGVEQNFVEAAYWFHQSELGGDAQAGKLCLKCTLDFVQQNFRKKTPEQLYADMTGLVRYVYADASDVDHEVCRKLYAMAGNHLNKHEYAAAAKLFRAAAEFGHDGYSQNYLAVLYNAGAGVEKNDIAALYWFDKAVENGAADVAQKDRDGILNAYKSNVTTGEFFDTMMQLSAWCSVGSEDVPKDAAKAAFWREIAERHVQEAAQR